MKITVPAKLDSEETDADDVKSEARIRCIIFPLEASGTVNYTIAETTFTTPDFDLVQSLVSLLYFN